MQSHPKNTLGRLVLAWLLLACVSVHGAIQFDVFAGYEGHAHTGSWFPVAVEVLNDGPSFDGVIEIFPSTLRTQVIHVPVSLPNGTRKRLFIPLFCPTVGTLEYTAQLRDEKGKLRYENNQVRVQASALEIPLLGVLPANFAGRPDYPTPKNQNTEWTPSSARIDTALFTDNPITLEGLNAIYLNSARALELKMPQVDALLSWLNEGGHLIVALDQPGDLNGLPWLEKILPARIGASVQVNSGAALQRWLLNGPEIPIHALYPHQSKLEGQPIQVSKKNKKSPETTYQDLQADPGIASAPLQVFSTRAKPENVVLKDGETPLILRQSIGRGVVTFLTFNPEREPFKTWKLRTWFWAGLTGVPASMLGSESQQYWGGVGIDALMAAMTETKQVRKPPVGLLIILLIGYLVVIGPFDQWWLKRIGRPMLTWVTFPCYVVLFSVLIYVIGYKLRAGRTEWNEIHIVDILPMDASGERAALRGRSFCNLYSPANRMYESKANLPYSGMRFEWNGVNAKIDQSRMTYETLPTGYAANFFVPVWSSELVVLDWLDYAAAPLVCVASGTSGKSEIKVENRSNAAMEHVWIFRGDRATAHFENLKPGETRTISVVESTPTADFVQHDLNLLTEAASSHASAFGHTTPVRLDDWNTNAAKISLLSLAARPAQMAQQFNPYGNDSRNFISPAGFDAASTLSRDDYLVLAWAPENVGVPALNSFSVYRNRRGTLLRIAVPRESIGRP